MGKVVRVNKSGNQTRVTIPRELALESDLWGCEFVEITVIQKGKLEVTKIEWEKAKRKGVPINQS